MSNEENWDFHCAIVGVTPTATLEQIKTAYRDSAKILHPDLHNNSEVAKKKFQQLEESYRYLTTHFGAKGQMAKKVEVSFDPNVARKKKSFVFSAIFILVVFGILLTRGTWSPISHDSLFFNLNHCVLKHSFMSQIMMGPSASWEKAYPSFTINCKETGKDGCQWGLSTEQVCAGEKDFKQLECVKHPSDASYSTDFKAMWGTKEKPELTVVPVDVSNVHLTCRSLDHSCDAVFNVYAGNNNMDTENVMCSGSYNQN